MVDKSTTTENDFRSVHANSHFSVFAKNARWLHTPDRLAELMGEIADVDWDIILFSETHRGGDQCKLQDGHVLFPSSQSTACAGVAVLVHRKHCRHVKRVCSISDRLMYVDLLVGTITWRLIATYLPHAGYSHEELCIVYEQPSAF